MASLKESTSVTGTDRPGGTEAGGGVGARPSPPVAEKPERPARAVDASRRSSPIIGGPGMVLVYLLLGLYFGVVLVKSEVVSWFRIQEMFRFQSFHMYGIIGSAVLVAAISVRLIKRFEARSVTGEPIQVHPKMMGRGIRYAVGGTLFGVGWALTGACPGPLFALFGTGVTAIVVAIASAVLGTWTYGLLRPKLPH